MNPKFIKEEKNINLNPVDYFNFYGDFKIIFADNIKYHFVSDTEVANVDNLTKVLFKCQTNGMVQILADNEFDIAINNKCSKFMLLTAVKFKKNYYDAMNYVRFFIMKLEIPYIRVGGDYYKIINKIDRYGGKHRLLKAWKKEEIKQDHDKTLLKMIYKFDDFDIIPDNKTFIPIKNGCFNLYNKFSHEEDQALINDSDIPVSLGILSHIFGEQINLGLKYMKVLYEYPKQILPILSLVSTERGTGKTTFLNWIHMIFGENAVLINPHDLTSSFNSIYATKNIIMVDETVIEKLASVEKLKSIATAKSISVSQKFVSEYSIPFFGKVILCTNKEKDFMKIDNEEVRFWVRKIRPVERLNTNIENDLFKEIPKFLKYLSQLEAIDFSKSRMVFTIDEITTNELTEIKEESKSSLHKELEILLDDFFNNNDTITYFEATATDIKDHFFKNNNNITHNYIHKVLKNELKLEQNGMVRYVPFGNSDPYAIKKTGKPFKFFSKSAEHPINIEKIQNEECPF
jgi:hypothetical protein